MTLFSYRRFRVTSALLATMATAACNCSTAVQQVKPSLSVTPMRVDFGLVAVGETSHPQVVNLRANTAAHVTITAVSVTTTAGGGNVFALQGTAPTTILQSSATPLSLVFTPTAATTYTGELVIKSNDATMPEYDILITGQGEDPQITVMPDHLGLTAVACPPGTMSMRCSDSQTVTISNMGMVDLQLAAAGVALVPAAGQTTVPPNLKIANQISTQTLFPTDTQPLTIVWQPAGNAANPSLAEVGNFSATLVIKSNDPAHPEVDIPITATGLPAGAPTACANVLSVTQREYVNNPQGGPPSVQQQGVPPMDWQDTADGGVADGGMSDGGATDGGMVVPTIHVRPGMTITLTSQRVMYPADGGAPQVDTQAEATDPCTADPDGFPITKTWTLTAPPLSSASLQPTMGTQTQLQIDAAGEYTVAFHTTNSLDLQSAPAVVNIDAVPRDDLFAQLSWKDAPGIDLDIHLLVDQGPGIGMPPANKHTASLFCFQDCFFFFFDPIWFTNSTGDEIPHLLRDDQGTSGQLESVDLITAPPNSSFRVAAHYWGQSGSVSTTKPQLIIRHQTTQYGPAGAGDTNPFVPAMPLANVNDAWFAVQVSFDANSQPTVTQLTGGVVNQTSPVPIPPGSTVPPDFTQPGSDMPAMCP